MGKNHMKRLAAPKSWTLLKKENKYITRPNPGAHPMDMGMSLGLVLKNLLKKAKTTAEAKLILRNKNVLVDGRRRRDQRFIVGFMDMLQIKDTDENYRMMINKKGKLVLVPVKKEESSYKPCRIKDKTIIRKGKVQVNFSDGRNITIDKNDYKTGDTLLVTLPEQSVKKHIKLDKDSKIYLFGGKHIGDSGTIVEFKDQNIIYKNKEGKQVETQKKYAFVIGADKEEVQLPQ